MKNKKPKINLVFELSPRAMEELAALIEGGGRLFSSTYRIVAEIRHIQDLRSQRRVVETTNAILLGARAAQQIGALMVNLLERKRPHGSNSPDQSA